MRRMIELAAVGAALAFVLSGCASAPPKPANEVSAHSAEAPTEEQSQEGARSDEATESAEASLLEEVRGFRAVPILDSTSDERVIAAAHEACTQLEEGTRLIDVDVIDRNDPAQEGVLLAKTAHAHLCPDAPIDTSLTP